jgi:hypothetical protein
VANHREPGGSQPRCVHLPGFFPEAKDWQGAVPAAGRGEDADPYQCLLCHGQRIKTHYTVPPPGERGSSSRRSMIGVFCTRGQYCYKASVASHSLYVRKRCSAE